MPHPPPQTTSIHPSSFPDHTNTSLLPRPPQYILFPIPLLIPRLTTEESLELPKSTPMRAVKMLPVALPLSTSTHPSPTTDTPWKGVSGTTLTPPSSSPHSLEVSMATGLSSAGGRGESCVGTCVRSPGQEWDWRILSNEATALNKLLASKRL